MIRKHPLGLHVCVHALVVTQHGALAQKCLAAIRNIVGEAYCDVNIGGFALDEIGVTVGLVVVEFPGGAIVKTAEVV